MKKTLAILCLIISIQFAYATDYYVSASTGDDNNNGTSPGTAWKTLSKIQQFSFSPGDQILLRKGDIWHHLLKLNSSGTNSNPITIRSYGTGGNPIVDVITAHNDLNWTDLGNNIWRTSAISYDPKRLLLDGVEMLDAAQDYVGELGTNIPDLVQWHYDDDAKILKMYSVDSPANHDIRFSSELYALSLGNLHDITIENIEFIGGYRMCVALSSCSRISLTNLKVGKYANFGIQMGAYKVNGENFQLCDSIIIDNCIVDSGYTFDYSLAGTTGGTSNRGPREGVLFRGTINCELKNSTIKNYCHANINIFAPADGRGGPQLDERVVQNCKVYSNIITSPDIAYGGRIAIDGYCFNNEIYNNLIINTSVQSQLNGYNNHIHHNVFKGTKSSPLKPYSTGTAIALQGYYIGVHDNIIENNLMIDCESAGIYISGNNGYGDVTNNVVRNNLIYNCGITDGDIGLAVSPNFNTYSNYGNTIENNLIYSENTTQTVSFYDTIMDSDTFNSQNGTEGYTIKDNLGADPLFIAILNEDYHLQNNSPCIDAGATSLSTIDADGNAIPFQGTFPDIGIYEYQGVLSNDNYFAENDIFLFPNPAKDCIYIKNATGKGIEQISIFDMTGKLIVSKSINKIHPQNNRLAISKLKQGSYLIVLQTKSDIYPKMFNKVD